ncbi:MAG: hypothetical protein JWM80_1091, partial [Cyanobacteria bacterium RYN_339]|nr:hypothetical protein [Cyanobacteria bacterium RYN_339]
ASTPQAIKVEGLPPNFDGLWAPTAYMQDGKLVLLYCAGNQTKDIMWPTFRLRRAVATTPGVFRDQGAIFPDLAPYGPGDQDFGVIDPVRWVAPSGKAYLSYTVVRYGVANKRYHEEAVHAREVDVHDPSRALGPDRVVYAGLPKTSDDGVAEASDVVTLGKRAYVFVSSRAGDKDQRVLVAPAPPDLGPLPAGALKPLLDPGGADWKAAAVGSTSAAAINGKAYMVFQGMDRAERFTLGWTSLDQ